MLFERTELQNTPGSRVLACYVEQNHDDKGIIWGGELAPFDFHVIGLNLKTKMTVLELILQTSGKWLHNEDHIWFNSMLKNLKVFL